MDRILCVVVVTYRWRRSLRASRHRRRGVGHDRRRLGRLLQKACSAGEIQAARAKSAVRERSPATPGPADKGAGAAALSKAWSWGASQAEIDEVHRQIVRTPPPGHCRRGGPSRHEGGGAGKEKTGETLDRHVVRRRRSSPVGISPVIFLKV